MAAARENAYFLRFADQLSTDIAQLTFDANFRKAGGSILLAVDFSEIYAYCMSASASVSLLGGKGRSRLRPDQIHIIDSMHDSIMLYYMFSASKELWLLDPYLIEFKNFLHVAASRQFQEEYARAAAAARTSRTLQDNPKFQELQELAKTLGDKHKQTPSVRRRILELFEDLAPDVVVLRASALRTPPVIRARGLLRERRLVLPDDVPRSVARGNPDVEARWLEALRARRPRNVTQNLSDAQAVAALYSINLWLQQKSSRPRHLALLTRSETMHEIMAEEVAKGLWGNEVGPLRHPRGVLALLDEYAQIVRDPPDRQIEILKKWQDAFGSLTDHRKTVSIPGVRLTPEEVLSRHTAVIYGAWRRYCGLSALVGTVEGDINREEREWDAIRILLDDTELNRLVVAHLDSLDKLLQRTHFAAGSLRSSEIREAATSMPPPRPARGAMPKSTPSDGGTMVHLFGGNGTPMPFRIRLYSPDLINIFSQQHGDAWKVFSALAVGDKVATGMANDVEPIVQSEWYTSIGYVGAALSAWNLTLAACEWVADQSSGSLDTTLLAAKARRRVVDDYDSLARAASALRDLPSGSGLDSLRLLAEKISYECLLLRAAQSDENEKRYLKHSRRAAALLGEAWVTYRQNVTSPERCELLNSTLYNLVELERLSTRLTLPPALGSYRASIAQIFPVMIADVREVYGAEPGAWPDSFLDTYAWTGLALLKWGEDALLEELSITEASVKEVFEEMPKRVFVGNRDQADFGYHADQARQYFARGE